MRAHAPWIDRSGSGGRADGHTHSGRHRSTGGVTPRQMEVWRCIAEGLTDMQTAARMGISYNTVKHHHNGLCARVGYANRAKLAAMYVERFGPVEGAAPADPCAGSC